MKEPTETVRFGMICLLCLLIFIFIFIFFITPISDMKARR